MPEATVHKNHAAPPGKDYIGGAWQILSMQAKPQPERVQNLPNRNLGRCIFSPYGGHYFGTRPGHGDSCSDCVDDLANPSNLVRRLHVVLISRLGLHYQISIGRYPTIDAIQSIVPDDVH